MNDDTQLAKLIMTSRLILFVAVVLLAVQSWQVLQGHTTQRQLWEYTIEAPTDAALPKRLTAIGLNGWEIVSARRATSEVNGETIAAYEMILRRPAAKPTGELPPIP